MALVITQGEQQHKAGTFQSQESIAESTATVVRVLDNHVDVSFLGMGTATGDNRNNLFALLATSTEAGTVGDAIEGMIKWLGSTATGEAAVFVEMPTQGLMPPAASIQTNPDFATSTLATTVIEMMMASATGKWVFQSDGDFLLMQFRNGTWNYIDGAGATMATAT